MLVVIQGIAAAGGGHCWWYDGAVEERKVDKPPNSKGSGHQGSRPQIVGRDSITMMPATGREGGQQGCDHEEGLGSVTMMMPACNGGVVARVEITKK